MILSQAEFMTALTGDSLHSNDPAEVDRGSGAVIVGKVRLSGHKDHFAFSSSASCGGWMDISRELIEEVEPLGRISCDDHEHDLVLIQLRTPDSSEARLLTKLLDSTAKSLEQLKEVWPANPTSSEAESEMNATKPTAPEGFRLPSIPRPSLRPPVIAIPPIVPGQVNRLSRFSKCAKCKMYTELALAGLVAAAFAAAGAGTGPGAIAALKLALAQKFGEAAASAALGALISRNNSEAAKIICRVQGKC